MIKVDVMRYDGKSFSSAFNTEEDADAWIASQVATNSWGKPERWVMEGDESEDYSRAIDTREEEYFGETRMLYKLPVDYEITKTDISLQIAAQKALHDQKAKREFGEAFLDKLSVDLQARLTTSQEIEAIMFNPKWQVYREFLKSGYLETFLGRFQEDDTSELFTETEKAAIIDSVGAFVSSLG